MDASAELIERAEQLRTKVDGHPEHCAEVMPQLTAMLSITDDPDVLIVVAQALHAAWNEEASLVLLPYVTHPDERVRLAVTRVLPGGLESPETTARVANALIMLTNDSSATVRDWATFGLGSIMDVDTPAVRETLRERLFDSDLDTRLEALVGLAERRDQSVLGVLRDELQTDTVQKLVVDAARAFADPSLLPLLLALKPRWDLAPDLLERAIQTCTSGEQEA
jgi:HEAT repeat protein